MHANDWTLSNCGQFIAGYGPLLQHYKVTHWY